MPPAPKASAKNRPYSSRPRQRSQPPDAGAGFDAPTPAERRRMDQEQSKPYRESYEAGRKHGRTEGTSKGSKPSSSKRSSSKGRHRSVAGSKSVRQAARTLQAPAREQFTSGLRLLGMALALTALYAVLTNASAFSGVLGGLGKAVEWLGAPRGIPSR
jgi:hypothetical protein